MLGTYSMRVYWYTLPVKLDISCASLASHTHCREERLTLTLLLWLARLILWQVLSHKPDPTNPSTDRFPYHSIMGRAWASIICHEVCLSLSVVEVAYKKNHRPTQAAIRASTSIVFALGHWRRCTLTDHIAFHCRILMKYLNALI